MRTEDYGKATVESLQQTIESHERSVNVSINQLLISLDANIDDLTMFMNGKRPEARICHLSVCDLWLRLKAVEHMEPSALATFLRRHQLHRPDIPSPPTEEEFSSRRSTSITNPRRSRLIHCHIHPSSDPFSLTNYAYVGLMLFSYDYESRFQLNGHFCQRGDIIIKQMKHLQVSRRGVYDALFRWHFDCSIDERFFGLGFVFAKGKCHFDYLTFDSRILFPYEFRVLDMFILTHWLTTTTIARNVQQMEINASEVLRSQMALVKSKFVDPQQCGQLRTSWNETLGVESGDLPLAMEQFQSSAEAELEAILKDIHRQRLVSGSHLINKT